MTVLPGAAHAKIDPAKIRDYLLSSAHPVGRFKARFFARLGYAPCEWQLLRDALLEHARTGSAHERSDRSHGRRFEVRGSLKGPTGLTARVVSAWILRADETAPRFVTAYPE